MREDRTQRARTADALALGLWESRDLMIYGFEMKASRSNWKGEVQNPQKAEETSQFCDYWSILALPGVVLPQELPKSWGLYELHDAKLKRIIDPTQRQAVEPTRAIMASILGAILDQCAPTTEDKRQVLAFDKGFLAGKAAAKESFDLALTSIQKQGADRDEEWRQIRAILSEIGLGGPRNHLAPARLEILKILTTLIPTHNLEPFKARLDLFKLVDRRDIADMENRLLSIHNTAESLLKETTQKLSVLKSNDSIPLSSEDTKAIEPNV